MVRFPGVRMLYRLPTPINNLERCLNMETLCSSTTKGTGCAAAVPEEEKKEGGKKGCFGEDSHFSFINPPTALGHGTWLEDLQIAKD